MTLGEKQELFAELFAFLIIAARQMGFRVRIGEVYRPPETAALYEEQNRGIANSLHTKKLAADIMLFRDGKWLKDTEDYRKLGERWESMHELCRWGGRFGDGGHFSIAYGGRA